MDRSTWIAIAIWAVLALFFIRWLAYRFLDHSEKVQRIAEANVRLRESGYKQSTFSPTDWNKPL